MAKVAIREENHSNFKAWIAVVMGSMFYGYQFILRVSPNVMTDELMLTFGVDATLLAVIVSTYYYGYSGMQVPLGVLMDRIGARKLISGAAILCALATIIFAHTTNMYLAMLMRFFIGVGSACGYLGTLKLGSQWLPREKMPYVVGTAMMLGTAGACLGTKPLEYLLNHIGWQESLYLLSVLGVMIAGAILALVGNNPQNETKVPEDHHLLQDLFHIIRKPQAWLIAVFAMLMYVPLTVMGDLWGVSFLESKFNIEESQSTIAMISMFLGVGIGAQAFAWLTDYLNSRKKPMIIGAAVTVACYIAILYMPNLSFEAICALYFLAGFFFNGQCISFSCICEIMPAHASGVAVGFINMIIMSSGIIFLPIIGRILVMFWDGKMVNDVPVYAAQDFQIALSLVPVCLIISLFLMLFIKETNPKVNS